MDIRKIAIIFVIGALFAIFSFSTTDAFFEDPRNDFCDNYYSEPKPYINYNSVNCTDQPSPSDEEYQKCDDNHGYIVYKYGDDGCVEEYMCSCEEGYAGALARYELYKFLMFTFFALVGIGLGIVLPLSKNPLNEWVGTGFMLGGFVCLFIGTASYYEEMSKFIRPLVILIELVIIVLLSYRKLGDINKRIKK